MSEQLYQFPALYISNGQEGVTSFCEILCGVLAAPTVGHVGVDYEQMQHLVPLIERLERQQRENEVNAETMDEAPTFNVTEEQLAILQHKLPLARFPQASREIMDMISMVMRAEAIAAPNPNRVDPTLANEVVANMAMPSAIKKAMEDAVRTGSGTVIVPNGQPIIGVDQIKDGPVIEYVPHHLRDRGPIDDLTQDETVDRALSTIAEDNEIMPPNDWPAQKQE